MRTHTVTLILLALTLLALPASAQGSGGTPSGPAIPTWATGAYVDSSVTMTLSIGEHWPPPGGASGLGPVDTSDYYTIPQTVVIPLGARPYGFPISIVTPYPFPDIPLQQPPAPGDQFFQCWFEEGILATSNWGRNTLRVWYSNPDAPGSDGNRTSVSPFDMPAARPMNACVLSSMPGMVSNGNTPLGIYLNANASSVCACGLHTPLPTPDMTGVPTRIEDPQLWGIFDVFILKMAAVDYWWYQSVRNDIDWQDPDWMDGLADAYDEMKELVAEDYHHELQAYLSGS